MKRTSLILTIIITILVIVSTTITFAWIFLRDEKVVDKEFGNVDVKSNLYFLNGTEKTDPILADSVLGISKVNTYRVNVTDINSLYHINKLRLDFEINSKIDTYFRIKVIDTLTATKTDSSGKTYEYALVNEEIPYEFNQLEDWYFDISTNWLYYKNKVNNTTNEISYITEGLNYGLKPLGYSIQFMVIIDAVQAHLGPLNNWGLSNAPWGGNW